jgi:hypothetical protein
MEQQTDRSEYQEMFPLVQYIIIQDVTKRALQFLKLIQICSEDMYSVLISHTVGKHTEFYLR